MSAPVADAAVRQQALDPQCSFIVQAPAGSGKTELLTRRILTLLATVDEPEEILAITFTRKAASEMRQRVIRTLHDAAEGAPVADDYQQQGRALADAVLARDESRDWRLLENPSRLSMQTIDSLCAVLTRQLPVTSNFGAQLDVLEDSRRLYMLAAERCIESNLSAGEYGYEALLQLLSYLDNNAERLQKLLADMLGNRDQWLRHYRQAGSREKLETDLAELVADRFDVLASLVPLECLDTLPQLIKHASDNLAAFDMDSPVLELADLADHERIPTPSYDTGAIWQLLADLLITKGKAGNFRKAATRKEGFPTSAADAKELETTVAELKTRKASFVELLNSLKDCDGLESLLKEIRELPLGGYSDEQWAIMGSLLELLSLSVAELHFVFAEHGSVDFTEIALRTSSALGEEDAPTDLALAMDYRLKHILVDEFQDTSISQDALFSKLVAGWEPDDGRTFFAVGDPMQSIYRFRDAEVSLFLRASQFGIGGISLIPLQLEVNFRSDGAIVEWCNTSFSQVFPQQSNMTSGAVCYAHSIPAKSSSSIAGQHFHAFVDSDRAIQADWVAELVESALDQSTSETAASSSDAPGTIAILVRSKAVLKEIFPALQQRNILYQAIDIETLGDRLVVRDILALCRALQHPQDRIHWLALLRAPWCGLSLDDLHALIDGQPATTVWSLLNQDKRLATLSDDGRERIERVRAILQPAVQRALREPLLPWVEALWLKLGGPAGCQYAQDLLAAEACFRELSLIEQAGLLSNSRYVEERMGNLFAPALQGESIRVQIMTIHKSKGLEFDTVILPALERMPRGDDTRLLNWFEYFGEQTDAKLLLAPIPETNVDSDSALPIVKLVKSLQAQKSSNELIRLLYVAATRAKRHLHLLGTAFLNVKGELRPPPKASLLAPLWPLLTEQFENQFAVQTAEQAGNQAVEQSELPAQTEQAVIPGLRRIKLEWRLPDLQTQWQSREVVEAEDLAGAGVDADVPVIYDWASANARHVGTVVHRQLQRIADEGASQWTAERVADLADFYQTLLKTAGVPGNQLEKATSLVTKALSNALSDTLGAWLLSADHQQSCSEYKLTGVINEQVFSGIVDRTFVDDKNIRWIIDFKTGSHHGKNQQAFLDREQQRYQAQLERYAVIMQSLDNREIRLGLYFPLLSGWREWQYNALSQDATT